MNDEFEEGGSRSEEIFSKIEEEHRRGDHKLGPMAGCSLCAAQPPAPDLEALARLRVLPVPPAPAGVGEIRDYSGSAAAAHPQDEPSLADLALGDAEQALADLDDLAQRGIVVPNAEQAVVHALVGVVRALAAIEEQLRPRPVDDDPDPEGEYRRDDGTLPPEPPKVAA